MSGVRNFRGGGAGTGFRAGVLGPVGGAVLGACLVAAGGASAYSSGAYAEFSGTEGDTIAIEYSPPTFPHMMRASHSGFAGVRYKLCTSDGTAKGAP